MWRVRSRALLCPGWSEHASRRRQVWKAEVAIEKNRKYTRTHFWRHLILEPVLQRIIAANTLATARQQCLKLLDFLLESRVFVSRGFNLNQSVSYQRQTKTSVLPLWSVESCKQLCSCRQGRRQSVASHTRPYSASNSENQGLFFNCFKRTVPTSLSVSMRCDRLRVSSRVRNKHWAKELTSMALL